MNEILTAIFFGIAFVVVKNKWSKAGNKILMTLLVYIESKYWYYLLGIASFIEMIDLISISPLAQEMKLCAS